MDSKLIKYYEEIQDSFSFVVTASKGGYTCCECGEYLCNGDEFEISVARERDEWIAFSTCLGCKKIRESLAKEVNPTDLWDTVEHYYGCCLEEE